MSHGDSDRRGKQVVVDRTEHARKCSAAKTWVWDLHIVDEHVSRSDVFPRSAGPDGTIIRPTPRWWGGLWAPREVTEKMPVAAWVAKSGVPFQKYFTELLFINLGFSLWLLYCSNLITKHTDIN